MSEEQKPETDDAVKPAERQWPYVYTLKHPIEFGSERITSLEFRRGRAGDMNGIALRDDIPANDLMLIAARLCGKPREIIERLDIDDAGEVNHVALDFYVRFLKAGSKH